jgi:hypothetical protein
MRAQVGDQIVIRSTYVDEPVQDGEVLEVRGADGAPPYRVRWSDNGHEALLIPGPDATVRHVRPASRRVAGGSHGLDQALRTRQEAG